VAPSYHALFLFFRAVAEREAGRYRGALAMLESVRRSGWFSRGGYLGGYGDALHGQIAVAHAMLEQHDRAAESLAIAQREQTAAQRGTLLLLEVLVLARAGRYHDASTRITADLEHAEQLLPARRTRLVRVLQVFCECAAGGDYRRAGVSPSLAEAVADRTTRASLDRWAVHWPELRAFLDAHAPA
jgi:hypothetical protein